MRIKKVFISFLLVLSVISITGCITSTNVNFNSDVQDAKVYIDGRYVGTTPITYSMSNAIWESPDIKIEKEGYKTVYTSVDKELKAENLILGLLIDWPALLWSYGPKSNQFYSLVKDPNYVPAETNEE